MSTTDDASTESTIDPPPLLDEVGLAGSAAGVDLVDADDRQPAVVRGSYRIAAGDHEQCRVILDIEGRDQLLDTARERVEVLS